MSTPHAGFRTIRVSDRGFAHEGLQFLTVKCASLKGRGDITLWLPLEVESLAELPLIILLHGVYGSHWGWAFSGGAHRTAARLISDGRIRPVGLVMPSDGLWGDGSAYTRHADRDFERWIVDDVPEAARLSLPERLRDRTPLFLAGLSMGGFGALRLASKYGKERFCAVSAHSTITHFRDMALFVEEPLESYGVSPEDESVLETMLTNRDRLPAVRFDCGTSDLLIEQNRALHRSLDAAGVPHVYDEFPGCHSWEYWTEHLADTLAFCEAWLCG